MNEPRITVQGNVGTDVRNRAAGGQSVADFRLAVSPRRLDRASGAWVEEETQWYTVTAWRELAEHCTVSLHRGDPVVVHGRLAQRTWSDAHGVQHTSMEVTATGVGHDLSRGTSTFTRRRPAQVEPAAQPVVESETRVEAVEDATPVEPAAAA